MVGEDIVDPDNSPNPLHHGTIHLWTADLKTWIPHAEKLRYLLSSEELGRLDRRKIQGKKDEFLCSRSILRIILSKYVALDPETLIIMSSSSGKPYLPDSGIEFNISHSRDMLICGISSKQKIGLDIQEVYDISSMDRIIQNHFSPAEIQHLKDLPNNDMYREHFFAIWTAKEAYFKGLGDGIKDTFKKVSIIPGSVDIRTYSLSLPISPTEQFKWTIIPVEISPGYIAALAYEGSINEQFRYEITPKNYIQSLV